MSVAFDLYNKLTNEEKGLLDDLTIILSIESCSEGKKELTQEEKERLLIIVNKAIEKDSTNTHPSTVADEIVTAYITREVSLEALEMSSPYNVINCAVGITSFQVLEEDYLEELENESK
ncbi:MAG: hypothetical protein Q4G09_00315 [Clostridia bacterium]|nr:hypothetical protein [Clostridia bacterium]